MLEFVIESNEKVTPCSLISKKEPKDQKEVNNELK